MTKKDYIIIADCFNKVWHEILKLPAPEQQHKEYVLIRLLEEMRDKFIEDNENFDFYKFKKAVYKIN